MSLKYSTFDTGFSFTIFPFVT